MRTSSSHAIVALCAGLAGAQAMLLFGFGPLDPPNGPISPTYKTLSEVEPRTAINAANTPGDADSKFKITQPGSYYLTGNITGVSGKSGIEVAANCTIDLNGFELTGVNGSLDGITLVGQFHGTVRNGQIVSWSGNGIVGTDSYACLFEDLFVADNGGAGLLAGTDSVVSHVRACGNGGYGIQVQSHCTIVDCVGSSNKTSGIHSGSFSTVNRCNAHDNTSHGISSLEGGNISDSVALANDSAGIRTAGGIVRDNVCDGNILANVYVTGTGGAIVRGNTCSNSITGSGIYAASGRNLIEANLLVSNWHGLKETANSANLEARNYGVQNVYKNFEPLNGNNVGALINSPGYFSDPNSWANLSAY